MSVSYNGLWKLLIDKNMKKMDLVENENIGISISTLAKMTKGETVLLYIFGKICVELDCDFGNLVHYQKDEMNKQDEK
jgi:DNA-binding Xre family transcriptional regulator